MKVFTSSVYFQLQVLFGKVSNIQEITDTLAEIFKTRQLMLERSL